MFKLETNNELLQKHIKEISKKIITSCRTQLVLTKDANITSCLNYIIKNIDVILGADTSKMINIINFFQSHYPNSTIEKKTLNKILRESIFEKEYDNWTKRTVYGAYYFVKKINTNTCPYCNRNYTFIIDTKKEGKLRPQIDHFYPKSTYPFLAMSYYNLIPSCGLCNHTKSDKDAFELKLINPYDFKGSDIEFTYSPKDVSFAQVSSKKYNFDNFDIKFKKENSTTRTFKLDILYSLHKDIVLDLLIKKVHYPESYIIELQNNFGFSKDEIYRIILNSYSKEEDLHKRPLSKLIKDISKELNLMRE